MIEKMGAAQPLNSLPQQPAAQPVQSAGDADFAQVLKTAQNGQAVSLDAVFEEASAKYGVSVSLLKAVAKAESNFNPKATSSCGAMGIMQLMPGTASSLGVSEPYDPVQNIMGGAKYLSQLLTRFDGDVSLAVAGYNAGPGNVVKYGGIPPFDETENYVTKVLGYLGSDISAGTVTGSAFTSGTGLTDGISDDGNALGALLKYTLLSGMLDSGSSDGLPSLLGSLGTNPTGLDGLNSSNDPTKLSDAAMSAVYQMQLRMLQGDDDSTGFLA